MRTRLLGRMAVAGVLLSAILTAQEASKTYHSAIEVGEARWTLDAKVRAVTFGHRWAGELILYTVRREGTFAHCVNRVEGGRFIGMRMSHTSDGFFTLTPFPRSKPRGWLLTTASRCGNTLGMRTMVVVPDPRSLSRGELPDYRQALMDSKNEPLVRVRGEKVEFWGAYQDWGGGGTSASTLVPFLNTLQDDGRIVRSGLPADFREWPSRFKQPTTFQFPGVFVAGLRERNPELMRQAMDELFAVDCLEWCRCYGLPSTRPGLEDVIATMTILARARARLEAQLPDIGLGDPASIEAR